MKKTSNICITTKDLAEIVLQSAQADLIDFPDHQIVVDLTGPALFPMAEEEACGEVSWKVLI